jgi:SAM-dependent methyltransferase
MPNAKMTVTKAEWNARYQERNTPWDSGRPSRELLRVLDEGWVAPCRAVELGCGTGTNAVFLATRGFEVTAIDLSPLALERARERAAAAGVEALFVEADVCRFDAELEPFDFVFDRGCYHGVRRVDLQGFLNTLSRLTHPGSKYLLLTGNANEQTEQGPPRLHEHELRADLERLFEFDWIRAFRFQEADGSDGPLGWSSLLTRRETDEGAARV